MDNSWYQIIESHHRNISFKMEKYHNGYFFYYYEFNKSLFLDESLIQDYKCSIKMIPKKGIKLIESHHLSELKAAAVDIVLLNQINYFDVEAPPSLSAYWDDSCKYFLKHKGKNGYVLRLFWIVDKFRYDDGLLFLGIPHSTYDLTLSQLVKYLSFTKAKSLEKITSIGKKSIKEFYSIFSEAGISLDPKNYMP
ncbi:hypothetical protein MM239_01875 [Belliella sp. DSM 111904]|uniref:Uncharacterized protein n=1 Tax=Belliella filtrata TaxID=2923435 RepID=A0ABS9UVZ0_9BACT|nr:hypothetical protein [Belliella filtrata]MCH7408129.1 hypothetical protein [Belliella filtrata]